MSAGNVQRPAKRRALCSSPTDVTLGLTRTRRRYQEGRDSPPAAVQNKAADSEEEPQYNTGSELTDLATMVVATSVSVEHRGLPVISKCYTSASSAAHTSCIRKCSRQKLRDANRKSRRILNVQRALLADADGDRPLHLAVVHRDAVLVRQICCMLHSVKAPLDCANYMRQTPLHLAVILREPMLVEALLEEGCSLSPRDSRGNTPLHLAASQPSPDCLTAILRGSQEQAKQLINERNFDGQTSLHIAVAKDNPDVVRALVEAGCDVDIGDGKSGRSPLMHAVYNRNLPIVRLLLQCGASPDAQDYAGNCGHTAACETDEAIADLLASKTTSLSAR